MLDDMLILEILEVLGPRALLRSSTGCHSHQCGDCGHVFSHADSCSGEVKAHDCPKCGSGPWTLRISRGSC